MFRIMRHGKTGPQTAAPWRNEGGQLALKPPPIYRLNK